MTHSDVVATYHIYSPIEASDFENVLVRFVGILITRLTLLG